MAIFHFSIIFLRLLSFENSKITFSSLLLDSPPFSRAPWSSTLVSRRHGRIYALRPLSLSWLQSSVHQCPLDPKSHALVKLLICFFFHWKILGSSTFSCFRAKTWDPMCIHRINRDRKACLLPLSQVPPPSHVYSFSSVLDGMD